MPHIVDILIEERAERLMRNPRLWQTLKTALYPALGYQRAIELFDEVADMRGFEVFSHVSNLLQMNVVSQGLEHLPRQGRAIVMLNHPAGIADGVAVFDSFKSVREDISFFANRDAIRVSPGLADLIVPVEWVGEKRSHERRKETVKSMVRAFREERLIVIFPSGRLAQPTL